jgi:CheY-like chemotaxis protein
MNNMPLSVVLVDDELQITDLLETFLKCISKNLDIYSFNDPEEARAYLLQNNPDVLITDYKMPKFDGLQLIKLMPPNSTKVLISGYVSEITEGHVFRETGAHEGAGQNHSVGAGQEKNRPDQLDRFHCNEPSHCSVIHYRQG